jgi:uncharacterized membrane protein YccC
MGVGFVIGVSLTAILAATVKFAILPRLESFPGFCLAFAIVLVPAGAGAAQGWRTAMFTAMAVFFIPILAPLNEMVYDTAEFYNQALAIVCGFGAATLSFRLIPPLSPAFRTQRLLALTLRDLRRLAKRPTAWSIGRWDGIGYRRFATLPVSAPWQQLSQLLAAMLVGAEILRLNRVARRAGLQAALEGVLGPLSGGDVTAAVAGFAVLDDTLAVRGTPGAFRARARILGVCEALAQHAAYFEMEVS